MSIVTSRLLRAIIPKFIHKRILAGVVRRKVLDYYGSLSGTLSDEVKSVLDDLKTKPVTVFPYHPLDQYAADSVKVYKDKGKGLHYVLLDGKRLYFKKKWNKGRIRKSFIGLLREQDPICPHCYEKGNFKFDEGEVLVDVGAAEGNYALSVVEKASRIILFESDKNWIEALNATFKPWKDKVTIVNKFVGDVNNSDCVTLDDFFSRREKISFIKIDVEGAESQLLKGCERILQEVRPLKLAICTYHKQDDEEQFTKLLNKNGFETQHSDGFMLVYHDRRLKAPYLRRGMIRATKS
jgi:hypothetical protein